LFIRKYQGIEFLIDLNLKFKFIIMAQKVNPLLRRELWEVLLLDKSFSCGCRSQKLVYSLWLHMIFNWPFGQARYLFLSKDWIIPNPTIHMSPIAPNKTMHDECSLSCNDFICYCNTDFSKWHKTCLVDVLILVFFLTYNLNIIFFNK